MSCRTMCASDNEGVVRMSVTSFGPHCRLPPPTITMRIDSASARSRYVALTVQPAEQHRDCAGAVTQLVTCAREYSHLRRPVCVRDDAGVEVGHEIVVRAVNHE